MASRTETNPDAVVVANETTVPLLPCVSADETLDFYRSLGFEVTYEMRKPYRPGSPATVPEPAVSRSSTRRATASS